MSERLQGEVHFWVTFPPRAPAIVSLHRVLKTSSVHPCVFEDILIHDTFFGIGFFLSFFFFFPPVSLHYLYK